MGVLDIPKAVYKAQQAKKKMSKMEVVGTSEFLDILVNGINEVKDAEINKAKLKETFADFNLSDDFFEKLAKLLASSIKDAFNDSKKKLEKELMNSTDLEELKGLLGG